MFPLFPLVEYLIKFKTSLTKDVKECRFIYVPITHNDEKHIQPNLLTTATLETEESGRYEEEGV